MSVCVFHFVVWNDSFTLTKKAFKGLFFFSENKGFLPLYTCVMKKIPKYFSLHRLLLWTQVVSCFTVAVRSQPTCNWRLLVSMSRTCILTIERVTSQFWLKRCQNFSPVCSVPAWTVTPRALQSLAVQSSKCTSTVTASCQNPLKVLLFFRSKTKPRI